MRHLHEGEREKKQTPKQHRVRREREIDAKPDKKIKTVLLQLSQFYFGNLRSVLTARTDLFSEESYKDRRP